MTGDNVNSQGQKVHFVVLITFDGKDQPVVGAAQPTTWTSKWIDDRTWEYVAKVNGQMAGTTRLVMARDGKTGTTTVMGKNPQGQPFKGVALWEKQYFWYSVSHSVSAASNGERTLRLAPVPKILVFPAPFASGARSRQSV